MFALRPGLRVRVTASARPEWLPPLWGSRDSEATGRQVRVQVRSLNYSTLDSRTTRIAKEDGIDMLDNICIDFQQRSLALCRQ